MPPPPALPPLPPPRLELPRSRQSRAGGWLSLIAHLLALLAVVELTRETNFWQETEAAGRDRQGAGGGGGGRREHLIQLPAAAPPPAPPPILARVTPPAKVPTRIPPVEPQPVVTTPVPDTLPARPASADTSGSGGGSGGGTGTGTGPGSGPGAGPGTGGGSGGGSGDSTRTGARPPEPTRLILPPFDYPRSMRGLTVDVNFFVRADGRVERVVFVPEIPDRGYSKKLEEAMRAYRFRPARSADGQSVPGIAIVKVSF